MKQIQQIIGGIVFFSDAALLVDRLTSITPAETH
jgi:hypothetical protein